MAITFQAQEIDFNLKHKAKIKVWIKHMIESEKKVLGQINYVFTTDESVLKSNLQFLNHSTYTDIITFDYNEGNTVNGDILISVERVTQNAGQFKSDLETEVRRVIIHGVLHLCGYKDKSAADIKVMRAKEEAALKVFSKRFE